MIRSRGCETNRDLGFQVILVASTLLPEQDNLALSAPTVSESRCVVSCGVRLSEEGVEVVYKPRVTFCVVVLDRLLAGQVLRGHRDMMTDGT